MIFLYLKASREFLARIPWQVWMVAAVLLTGWLWGNHRYGEGVDAERGRWEASQAAAMVKADKATAKAGEQRAKDTVANTQAEKERTDAILANPDDPRRALTCERLRAAGIDASASGC